MESKIISISEIFRKDWDDLVRKSSVASWFQTYEAYSFFDSLSFLDAFAIGVKSNDCLKGVIVGYIQKDGGKIKQFFSRRAIINGGPLLATDITEEELSALLTALTNSLKNKAIYIEFRNYNDYGRWRSIFERNDFVYQPHYDIHVDTSTLDSVNTRLDRNRKRNIRKATENGLWIDEAPSENDLHIFYDQLQNLYETKVKTPLYPYEFFQKLYNMPSSRFFIAKDKENVVIGGTVCVSLEGKAVYVWFACGEDKEHKKLSPSVMVNYAAICHAAENGFAVFDFMGAGKPNDGGYGVRDFKLDFGGTLVEYGRFLSITHPLLYQIGKLGVKIMKLKK